jgi:hypothetical protein
VKLTRKPCIPSLNAGLFRFFLFASFCSILWRSSAGLNFKLAIFNWCDQSLCFGKSTSRASFGSHHRAEYPSARQTCSFNASNFRCEDSASFVFTQRFNSFLWDSKTGVKNSADDATSARSRK